jgi:pantothenate kinase-related protein Tda10
MQEVDYRERNLRFAEVSLFASLIENLLMLTVELIPNEAPRVLSIKKDIRSRIDKSMSQYEAELYQDRYLPEYQGQMRELSRREKEAEEAKRKRDQEALDRVASFSAGSE